MYHQLSPTFPLLKLNKSDDQDRTSKREVRTNFLEAYNNMPTKNCNQTSIKGIQTNILESTTENKLISLSTVPDDSLNDFRFFNQFLEMLKPEGWY